MRVAAMLLTTRNYSSFINHAKCLVLYIAFAQLMCAEIETPIPIVSDTKRKVRIILATMQIVSYSIEWCDDDDKIRTTISWLFLITSRPNPTHPKCQDSKLRPTLLPTIRNSRVTLN